MLQTKMNPGRAIGQEAQTGATGIAKADEAGKPGSSTKPAARKYAAQRAWKLRNPLATWAHSATRSAIRRGLLTRKPCEVCGAEAADAHHPDHARPLLVRWLCRKHHKAAEAAAKLGSARRDRRVAK
jgi:hypothetical protein